jgi:hypothetical protein
MSPHEDAVRAIIYKSRACASSGEYCRMLKINANWNQCEPSAGPIFIKELRERITLESIHPLRTQNIHICPLPADKPPPRRRHCPHPVSA